MPKTLSRHNLLVPVVDSDRWLLLNPLSGNADLLDAGEAAALQRGEPADGTALAERGYLVEEAEEQRRLRAEYLRFTEERDDDEVQLLFVPTYACNFGCGYCYQDEYDAGSGVVSLQAVAAFFAYVDRAFAGRRKYITLFGGEPLLRTPALLRALERFVDEANARQLELAVVTNGYFLAESLPLLQRASVREVQVTLDGPPEVHDRRRPLKGGAPTFERIARGVDAALERALSVNQRVVVDRDNLDRLPELARVAEQRGWTQHPAFKTQLGRNYELHHCQAERGRLFTRLGLYQRFYALAQEHPELLRFHQPALHGARALAQRGELAGPLFDSCPACTTEWAFDGEGRIYSCTATVGKPGEALGTYYPTVTLDEERVAEWEDRDVLAIPECSTCGHRLLCGGGCGAVARNRTGRLHAPDCRPVPELMGLGLALYLQQET